MSEAFKKSTLRDTIESLVVTVILAVFGTTFVVQAFKIPSGSMEKTLLIGDHLLVNKFIFAIPTPWIERLLPYREIRRGDIVVFKFMWQPGEHYVKRVVGLPGDRLLIVNRQIYINGQPYAEPFVYHYDPGRHFAGDDFPTSDFDFVSRARTDWLPEMDAQIRNAELLVPPGQYFVMGDNRESSSDSRFWGFVPRAVITGKPLVVYWSYETSREEFAMNSWGDRIKQTFDLVVNFFSKTRWRRTFHWVR
ncbi:MAG: signal peptidase I [Acidobacteria bacterium]|nr:signal peptidase I [Acidobacteriota bacterium]